MARPAALRGLLLLLGLRGICAGLQRGNCTDYNVQFERVFSVPGDTAMLHSTMLAPDVFDFTSVPYNITWYDPVAGQEMSNQSGRVLVLGETLWFLNLQLEDAGEYVTVLRTPSRCYRQATKLVVEPPAAGECGRPRKAQQTLTNKITDILNCPLGDYVSKLDSYNVTSHITWYRGCEHIMDRKGRYTYLHTTKLKIDGVELNDNTFYTCTLTFTLGDMKGSVSETIEAAVSVVKSEAPQIREPANVKLTAQLGSSFSKRCLVFVLCVGKPRVDVVWIDRNSVLVLNTKPDHIYTSEQRVVERQELPVPGVLLERILMFSELREEDFHANYTCLAQSSRGTVTSYFTLLPSDPNILLPVGLLLGGVAALFIVSVVLYYLFKVDIVLWFRGAFPVLYTNTDLDGKSYDAYVAYPQACAAGFSQQVEAFALHTLPQVLEKACGYKLFIAGRDCMPGTAIVDSVEENIQASRRLLLLYTASTFISRRHTSSASNNNNNDVSKSSDNNDDVSKSSDNNNDVSKSSDNNNDVSKSSDNNDDVSKSSDNNDDVSKSSDNNDVSKSSDNNNDVSKSSDNNNDVSKSSDNNDDVSKSSDNNNDVSKSSDNNNDVSKSSDNNNDVSKSNNNDVSKSSDGDEDVCPDSRQQLECVTAMHRALLEGSLKVILVELEKISPAQLALFPESVRHLRKKQGAVCWWRNPSERRRWRTCTAGAREDEEKGERDGAQPSLCPSSGFWKEVRYRMPVRGKRALYPEKTALLNL